MTPSKPSSRGGRLAIERVAGAGQRPGPERRDVDPAARVGQPAAVALGHLDVGQQVMREQHRLGRLDVGRARQDGRAVPLGQARRAPARTSTQRRRPGGRSPGAATAAGPWRPGRCASGRCGACRRPGRSARPAPPRGSGGRPRAPGPRRSGRRRRPRPGPVRPSTSVVDLGRGQEPGPAETADVGDRAGDVVGRERAVELDRARERRPRAASFSSLNRPPQSRMSPP